MGDAPHGLRKPGEQEVPEGSVRGWQQIMRGTATHARASNRQGLPATRANVLGVKHGLGRGKRVL